MGASTSDCSRCSVCTIPSRYASPRPHARAASLEHPLSHEERALLRFGGTTEGGGSVTLSASRQGAPSMTEAVIVSACRTPIGTARKGTLVDVSAFDLAKYAVAEALARSGVPADDVDDIVLGEVLQGGG